MSACAALDIDAHLPAAVVHGVHQRPVALGDDVTAQLAGARQHAVIRAQFVVQDDKAVDLRFRQRRLLASSALTLAMQSAISPYTSSREARSAWPV